MNENAVLPRPAPARVLACGAFLKNRAARVDGDRLRWSAMHGDLDTPEACAALADSLAALLGAAATAGAHPVEAVTHDLHPDFFSSRLAGEFAGRLGVPAVAVQHHHAHIAAVIAEHGLQAPVIGIALDGVGLGSDGLAWGGELLWVDGGERAYRWQRLDHLRALPLPGGDVAAREPWRMAAAVLHLIGRGDEIVPRFAPQVGEASARGLATLLRRGLNCPLTTSAGRWFDAAAGALGLSLRQATEAEAAIALETRAQRWLQAHPDFDEDATGLDLAPLVGALLDTDPADTDAVDRGAARFHFALANGLAATAIAVARRLGLHDVALGGGCFLNRVLTGQLVRRLAAAGLVVHRPVAASCGDAGLALGQAWVAACSVAAGASIPSPEPVLEA